MHIHILGICGTFMGGIAAMAKSLGYQVTGSDQHVYPPMSTQLDELGIELHRGWCSKRLDELKPDLVLVGNALSRGNEMVEALIDAKRPFESAPAWLHQEILSKQKVIAIAGTHGKTTTTSMVAWILEKAGLNPGFLIGGKPAQFESSARVGGGKVFVVEADEYDTAFFDKRSKFVHYWPDVAVINNLEFDHADIFDSIKDIQKQMHHMIRTVSPSGSVLYPSTNQAVGEVLTKGCWSAKESMGEGGVWAAKNLKPDGSQWEVILRGKTVGTVHWDLFGEHQVQNALSAIASAHKAGVDLKTVIDAIQSFKLPKRRMELLGIEQNVSLYDDFAHHPTAIATTIQALKSRVKGRVGVILDLRSNTMRQGVHQETLVQSLTDADTVYVFAAPQVEWDVQALFSKSKHVQVFKSTDEIVQNFGQHFQAGDHWVVMSNGGFEGVHQRLLKALEAPSQQLGA